MANIYIENELKNVLDGDTWTVDPDGVTKSTYIWAESQSVGTDLNAPGIWNTTTNNVVFVIYPSRSSIIDQSTGGKAISFIGDLKLYASTVANMKSAFDALKTLVDQYIFLNIHGMHGGISGNPLTGNYWTVMVYNWNRWISD